VCAAAQAGAIASFSENVPLSGRQILRTPMSSNFRSPKSVITHTNPWSGNVMSAHPRHNAPVS